jgi:C2 domain
MADAEGPSAGVSVPLPPAVPPPPPHSYPLEEVDLGDSPSPPNGAEPSDPVPYGHASEEFVLVKELEDMEETALPTLSSKKSRTRAKLQASGTVRVSKKLVSNAVNKVEDVGLGLLGVTETIAGAGEGVGKAGLSGAAAAGSLVESGVGGLLAGNQRMRKHVAREVDTVTEVDISGTIVKDLNREIEIEQLKGTSNADSPLNTPWILLIFPIMYTKTFLGIIAPYVWQAVVWLWVFCGWRFWMCLSIAAAVIVVVAWDSIKEIGALRGPALQLDVHIIKLKAKMAEQQRRQEPKIYKSLDNLAPPVRAAMRSLDEMLTPKLGYSPLVAIRARYYGWKFDPSIDTVAMLPDGSVPPLTQLRRNTCESAVPLHGASGEVVEASSATPIDRGDGTIVNEAGERVREQSGVHFDAVEAAQVANEMLERAGAGEMVEQFFNVELSLTHLAELHHEYSSVWIEWVHRGLVVDRSVIRSATRSEGDWKGYGASFDDYQLTGEVRLPRRADTTFVKGGFTDVSLKLVLKGRDGLPIYSNDGARRYMRDSPRIYVIGEMELSTLKIGIGADSEGITRSLLRIPLHALGQKRYRAAVLYASARFTPVDMSSYSYRQMLSPLPNGEWTVRINVFELRNLQGVDASMNSDPFVQATTMGTTKSTDRQRKTLSCMVNQLLFFSKVCTGLEFEDEKIVIEVMDWNRLSAAQKIGVYTLDAKRILELPQKEVYRTWFALSTPEGGNQRPAGFIKMSITVIPPGGSPPQHDDAEDTEEFTSATLLKNTILRAPTMSYKNWAIHITVGWADMLPRMASPRYRDAVRGYMTFDYSGYEQSMTETNISVAKEVVDPNIGDACRVMPQRRVIWNEEYVLPLTIVNDRVSQEGIHLGLFHRVMPRLQAPFRENQLIGHVNVSFFELFKNMCTAVVRGQAADGEDSGDRVHKVAMMKPRYYNFYGMPDGPADPYDKGVAFRGRVLIGVAAKPGDVSKPFLRPCPPPPRPKLDFYKLDFCILRATELSLPNGWSVYVECRIGLYSFGHTVPKVFVQNQCVQWDENCHISIPNLQFPEDVEQIPDLFVTLFARKPSTVAVLEEEEHGKKLKRKGEVVSEDDEEGGATIVLDDHPEAHLDGVGGGDPVTRDDEGATTAAGIIPDATVQEGDGSTWQPKAFLRLPAKNLITGQTEARWIFMDYPGNNVLDTNDTKVPGSILAAASLSRFDPTVEPAADDEVGAIASTTPSSRMELSLTSPVDTSSPAGDVATNSSAVVASSTTANSPSAASPGRPDDSAGLRCYKSRTFSTPVGAERLYTLRALVLQGRNLPAADESGLSDPRVVVSIGNKSTPGKVFCRQTVSPLWQEIIEVRDIAIREGERKPNVNVIIYDYDNDEEPMQYLGRAIIPSAEMDTVDPTLKFAEWYPVFSVNPGVMVGEILADFQLIPNDRALSLPAPTLAPPVRTQSALRISLVGLRDVKFLKYASGDIFVECSVSGGSTQPFRSKRGAILQQRAYEANCNVLDVLVLDILVPEDLRLAPALNMYVYADYNHTQKEDMIATACIPLENWLSEHDRKLLTGECLIDDSYGMDTPISVELANKGYVFRRNARFAQKDEDRLTMDSRVRLHEIKAKTRSEKRQILALQESDEVLRVGYVEDRKRDKAKADVKETKVAVASAGSSVFASLRAVKNSVADALADVMPDVTQALGVEVEEDVPIAALAAPGSDTIDYDGTRALKKERGFCPYELEIDFCEPTYGEFLLFRGDNRGLGNTTGRMADAGPAASGSSALPPILPWNEAPSSATLKRREQRRANMEGARPAVGKVKARLDLVELDSHDEIDIGKVRLTSLRSFGRVFVPTEVVVRVYVLRGLNLQQVGSECNPYLTCKFYGGFPDFYSHKHEPVKDSDNPNFFQMFESRVKMPGGSVRIEVKDRVLPEVSVPLTYPTWIMDEGKNRFGMVSKEIPVNVGNLGLGWSEPIGETLIDLDSRWYNSAWRSLRKSPVETRALLSDESSNMKGQLELFVEIFDAKEVDKHPKLYRPLSIARPPQQEYVMRVVIYKVSDCTLPYKLAVDNPAKLASLYVVARLGNRPEDERSTDRCKYVADGIGQFNWRMKWDIKLPSVEIKPRLKITVFDDTSMGLGNNDDCRFLSSRTSALR